MKVGISEMAILIRKKMKLGGIALFPFIIINSEVNSERQLVLLNHERIHIRQQLELLIVPFYILYLLNYLVNRFRFDSHQEAYRNIIFEREAFKKEKDSVYLSERKMWNFLNY